MSGDGEKYVAALDVGTTKLKCIIFDQNLNVRAEAATLIELEYVKPGWIEMNPEKLVEQVNLVIISAVKKACIHPGLIKAMSISTQRCTFVCWDAVTGQALHNINSWKDTRASQLVKQWNSSFQLKAMRLVCKFLYNVTRNRRYLSGSVLQVMNEQVVMRLVWILENVPGIKDKISANRLKFGTLDTFLVYKLTGGEKHVTDFSNASPTGFFDPYVMSWADWALRMFSIPANILPEIVPTCGPHFGTCKLFPGVRIPILCVIADQSSSMFGSTSFHSGNVKVTLGTGAFLDVNTGKKPHASVAGIYPLVAWKYDSELVYMAEGCSKDNGIIVDWGKSIGLYDTVEESSGIAQRVTNSQGVYFVPAFSGLQAPYNDASAGTGFIGIQPTTQKAHLVRALLESLAFRVQQLLNVLQSETDFHFECIRVDGGVAKNDFILQTIANLTGKRVERPVFTEMTALGSALMAGIQAGIWKSREDLERYYKVEKVFLPKVEEEESIQKSFLAWENALERFLKWSKS